MFIKDDDDDECGSVFSASMRVANAVLLTPETN